MNDDIDPARLEPITSIPEKLNASAVIGQPINVDGTTRDFPGQHRFRLRGRVRLRQRRRGRR